MGGKDKQTQRTKNNVKPSNSSRSAELLGTAAPSFVGFSAHSDRLVPFAPGFTYENLPDYFDANFNPQLQLVLRKMSKKDPMTRKKALQELIDIIKEYDVEALKQMLPLWPKFYQNLANDPEHNVRELAQTTLQLLVSKCKRAIAPYLRQLVPIWLSSFFDNYAPAASIANNAFNETFAGNTNRIQEVCLHCQADIVEYSVRNLTFHTASTLSSGKGLTPEEAEQKYQRVVMCNLKALAFFAEYTASEGVDLSQVQSALENLLLHNKFLSYAKHKVPAIRAAWFEFFYHFMQNPHILDIMMPIMPQITTICFQNIDETDPLIAPQVWGCILQIQSIYDDWHKVINFKKTILSKVSTMLRSGFNGNAQAICPNLLPFFSKLSPENMKEIKWHEFCKQYFDDIKYTITSTDSLSKSDYSSIIKSYFECLRFMFQRIHNITERSEAEELLAKELLQDNILEVIIWYLKNENIAMKYFFMQTSALLAFWADRKIGDSSDCLYTKLFDKFWICVIDVINKGIEQNRKSSEPFLDHAIELMYNLHLANPSLQDQTVKFKENTENESITKCNPEKTTEINSSINALIQKELRHVVILLIRLCLDNIKTHNMGSSINHIRRLSKIFPDAQFFTDISPKGDLMDTLDLFINLIDLLNKMESEIVVDIVFEILQYLDKSKRFAYITTYLFKTAKKEVHTMVLQKLLSYPLCIESEVRQFLMEAECSAVIINVARDALIDHSKENLNLLHKCFFQTDCGQILIGSSTVDAILKIISEPLTAAELTDMVDECCSFIAQIMPVVCNKENSSVIVRHEVFFRLFKFSIKHMPNDFISEDTLWEITTCWQDALSSGDVVIDGSSLLESCVFAIKDCINDESLTLRAVDIIADAQAKFVTCSSENVQEEEQRLKNIDTMLMTFFDSIDNGKQAQRDTLEFCTFIELLKSIISTDEGISDNVMKTVIPLKMVFRRKLLNFSTIFKLYCKINKKNYSKDATKIYDEITEDFFDPDSNLLRHWSDELLVEILHCFNISAAGEQLINIDIQVDDEVESLIIELSEKVRIFMNSSCELVNKIKEKMMEESARELSTAQCRSLSYLVYHEQYAQFDENATILLMEDLSEYFITNNALKAYLNNLQYLLPKLESRSLTSEGGIMRTKPNDLWVRSAIFRCFIQNNFNGKLNEKSDKNIIMAALQFITEVSEMQNKKKLLLYNIEIHKETLYNVTNTVEYINLLTEIINKCPYELSIKNWDTIRIGLSSWALSVSKSINSYTNPKFAVFIVGVYKLFAALTVFMKDEKQKSSTELLKNVIDEWEGLFEREINIVLFKAFYSLVNVQDIDINYMQCYNLVLDEITTAVQLIDFRVIYDHCKHSSQISLDNLCNFFLKNLSNHLHSLRITCIHILRQLTQFFVAEDIKNFEKKSETLEDQKQFGKWHYLNRFEDYITRYDFAIRKYLDEFNFKLSDISSMVPIDRNDALSYLLLWDCIIYACANSPVSLRSIYTNWLNENKYEENLLHFLFRAMPVEILKNHDSKIMGNEIFRGLNWMDIKDRNLSLERYVCHLFTEVLRKLPAVVRKWWNTSSSRQKTFVDKLTTNFVSPIICNEELKTIGNKKEKHENMQVTVHSSTREVLAIYSIDEARMELVITLAQNYPLGAVKVECGKQIGGRSSSRNVGMQLTIFLTHQNGTIFDGLTLWKNNLDKKFEGVEECYICYTVIHQDTCQLPKLTCRTCKKKFHGPCMYKWFTTSSKSTCPICRNVF